MKNSIIALFIMLSVCAGFAFSQTKKRTVRRTAKKSGVTRIAPKPIPKIYVPARRGAKALTTASGLTYIVTQNGAGAQLKAGDTVTVHYTGLLTSGVKFDSSLDRSEPFSFELGAGKVIKGWDEGLQKLRVGDRATFFIPSWLGYGARGAGGGVIPPDAMLIFIIEVISVG